MHKFGQESRSDSFRLTPFHIAGSTGADGLGGATGPTGFTGLTGDYLTSGALTHLKAPDNPSQEQ